MTEPYTRLGPVVFCHRTEDERDALVVETPLTIFDSDTGILQSYLFDRWANVVYVNGDPVANDTLVWDPVLNLFAPSPAADPILNTLQVYEDSTAVVEVKRVYRNLVGPLGGGGSTGALIPLGHHTVVADTSYRIRIDTAGDWRVATFKWSDDGGATWDATLVPVATGSVSGSEVLAPITLNNGVKVLFTVGSYALNDYWDFVAIEPSNQFPELKIDTTNGRVDIGKWRFHTVGAIENIRDSSLSLLPEAGGGNAELAFATATGWEITTAAGNTLRVVDDGSDIAMTVGDMATSGYVESLAFVTPPAAPAAAGWRLFGFLSGLVARPFWEDENGLSQNMLPLTTKGDIYTFGTTSNRLAVGSNGQVLTADSGQSVGLKWVTNNVAMAMTWAFGG